MNHKPAIIFDLDGTLAHTAPDLIAAHNHCLSEQNFSEMTLEQMGHRVGLGSIAMIKHAFELEQKPLDDALLMALHHKFLDYYQEHIADHTELFPGALKLLQRLQHEDFKLCICTNKTVGLARTLLKELELDETFHAVTGGDSFDFKKPDPRHLYETITIAGCKNGIMIGDTVNDAEAAKNAEIPLMLVDFGYSDTPVATFNPDSIISHFDEAYDTIISLTEKHF